MPRVLTLIAASCVLALSAGAQKTRLTLSGFTGAMGTAAVTDFDNGSMQSATAIAYTVAIITPSTGTARTATVSISATTTTLNGTKPISDLQWRRNDLATWNSMTTTPVAVDSRSAFSGTGATFSNSIWLRVLLNWATDPASSYSTTVVITLSVTVP